MSSDYHVLCMSHDPAIRTGHDYAHYPEALAAAANPGEHEHLREHAHCDLLVGRYSSPLIEAACPGVKPHCPGYHRHDYDSWTDSGWLRLLHAAYNRGDDVTWMRLPTCWTRQRVLRLVAELGIETRPDAT